MVKVKAQNFRERVEKLESLKVKGQFMVFDFVSGNISLKLMACGEFPRTGTPHFVFVLCLQEH